MDGEIEQGPVVPVWRQLKVQWEDQGLPVQPPCSDAEIEMFERTTGLRLTSELRDYLQTVNGFDRWDFGVDFFSFYPLQDWHRITDLEQTSQRIVEGLAEVLDDPDSCFVLIDFLINSHVYAVRLYPERVQSSSVMFILDAKVLDVYPSFTEFVHLYLNNPNSVL